MTLLAELDPPTPSAEDEVLRREAEEMLHEQVDRMTHRHATALTMRYGLHGEGTSTYTEIGQTLGVTPEHARRIAGRAEVELRAIVVLDRTESTPDERKQAIRQLADIRVKDTWWRSDTDCGICQPSASRYAYATTYRDPYAEWDLAALA
jgi:tryptophan 2,3-dioxygenase